MAKSGFEICRFCTPRLLDLSYPKISDVLNRHLMFQWLYHHSESAHVNAQGDKTERTNVSTHCSIVPSRGVSHVQNEAEKYVRLGSSSGNK